MVHTAQDSQPPSRQERKKCHSARDAYFKCLDDAGIEYPENAGSACTELRKTLYKYCPDSWVRTRYQALNMTWINNNPTIYVTL